MSECKNHENMRKMMNPICAKDYGLGFKMKRDGSCVECGMDMSKEIDCLGGILNDMAMNKMIDNATIANPKHVIRMEDDNG